MLTLHLNGHLSIWVPSMGLESQADGAEDEFPDIVEVITSEANSSLHLHLLYNSSADMATDAHIASNSSLTIATFSGIYTMSGNTS